MSLQIQKLLSVSVQLSIEACNIIKNSVNNQSVHKFKKGEDDFVTDADFKIQSMLIRGFKMHFPELKIIGEETQEYPGAIQFNYSSVSQNFLPRQITSQIKSEVNINQSCLWIDPIDCTKGFIEGNIQDVTVLIGMSTNNSPQMGVIGIPFRKINSQKIYDPQIIIGSIQDKKAYNYYQNKWSPLIKKPYQHNSPIVVTTSNSRTNSLQQKYLSHMKAQSILAGGSGRKIVLVIKGEADMMAYVGSATHKWDSCAGQAIIKSLGGCFTTPSGKSINYDSKLQTSNSQGIFCSLNQNIHKKSLEFIKNIAK